MGAGIESQAFYVALHQFLDSGLQQPKNAKIIK
jgi:hypothetical protein